MIDKFSKAQLLLAEEDNSGWRKIESSKDKFKVYRSEDEIHISFKSMHEFNLSFFEYAYFCGRVVEEDEDSITMDWKVKIPMFNKIGAAFSLFVFSLLFVFDTGADVKGILMFLFVITVVSINIYFLFKKIRKSIAMLIVS